MTADVPETSPGRSVRVVLVADPGLHLNGAEWDVAIFLTDLPRRARLYPISVEVDTALRAALISFPPLGSAAFGAGCGQTVVDVVRELVAHEETPRRLPGLPCQVRPGARPVR
ncbi:hypothetical protein [Streptomyces sp. NPDC005262]|uniref:hypothetical protein n=1 Tax=Streptomyces sp. NPDC005262 TaxID=3364710 RepID=UPI003698FCB5